jgi:hypothetical protein
MEQWRDIPGYVGYYQASDLGNIRRSGNCTNNTKAGRLLSPGRGRYCTVVLNRNREKRTWKVHRLVMKAFVGPMPPGYSINHIDGNTLNNAWSNLEYVTHSDNVRHTFRTGRHGSAKLTVESAKLIRESTDTGNALAARFGVSPATISEVRSGHIWNY